MEKLRLPAEAESARKRIESALMTPLLAEWPEDKKFTDANQPEAIAGGLIAAVHTHLVNARIAFVFQKSMKRRDRIDLARTVKVAPKINYLTGYDFITTVNWEAWRDLEAEQRIALMDHQLAHCERDAETGAYSIRHHDVEEFSEVVRRWGLWMPDLASFGRTVLQLDMFTAECRRFLDEPSLAEIADGEAEEAERETVGAGA